MTFSKYFWKLIKQWRKTAKSSRLWWITSQICIRNSVQLNLAVVILN